MKRFSFWLLLVALFSGCTQEPSDVGMTGPVSDPNLNPHAVPVERALSELNSMLDLFMTHLRVQLFLKTEMIGGGYTTRKIVMCYDL